MDSKIKLPAMDLSFECDDGLKMNETFLDDQFYYSFSEKRFKKYFLNHILVDCSGNMYEIIGKEDIVKWKKYIPFFNIKKAKLIFKDLQKKMNIDEIKKHYVSRIKKYDVFDDEYHKHIKNWIKEVEEAKSIEELFRKYT